LGISVRSLRYKVKAAKELGFEVESNPMYSPDLPRFDNDEMRS